jgi:superfamily II DNA helicase RecQ
MFEKMKKLKKGTVIVVSPLRSLIKSQTEGLQKRNIKAIYLKDAFMSTDIEKKLMTLSFADVRKGEISILFASPESLLDEFSPTLS